MTKNIYLVPVIIEDIALQLENPQITENEKMALCQRLEAIKDFCIKTLNRENKKIEDINKKQTKRTSNKKKI